MSELTRTDQAKSACPKRSWVMSTLTDDERIDLGADLPQALRFHLSRCDSCRVLADHIGSVTSTLSKMADAEPPSHLLALAQARARVSIDRGGVLTGRVDVDNLEEMDEDESSPRALQWRPLRYAAAAIILIGFASIWISSQTQRAQPLVSGPDTWHPAIPAPLELAEDFPTVVESVASEANVQRTDALPRLVTAEELDKRYSETRFPRPACRHSSLFEAATCDNPNCIHRIRERPERQQRTLGWKGIFQSPSESVHDTWLLRQEASPRR